MAVARRTLVQPGSKPVAQDIEELSRQVQDLQRANNPFGYGVTISFTADGTNQVIRHTLQRIPTGWIVTSIKHPTSAAGNIIERSRDSNQLVLRGTNTVEFELLVY